MVNYAPHFLLEWGGDFVSDPTEIWSNGIRMTHNPEIDGASFPSEANGGSQALVDHYSAKVVTHFTTSAAGYGNNVRLKYVKFNEIRADGKRKNQSVTWRKDVAGVGTPGPLASVGPITTAMVITFLTAAQRGRASKGRVYVPHPLWPVTQANGYRYAPADTLAAAGQWKTFLDALADAPGADQPNALVASVMSGLETPGIFRNITNAQVGNFPDYMGSRRNKLKEVRTTSAAVNQTGL